MNPALTQLPSTDPAQLLRFRDRQYSAELIATALLHFDLFTWLDQNGGVKDADIAAHFGIIARPLDVLMTLCRASGLVTTDASGGNHLTAQAREHFVKGSPWYLGPYYAPIRDTPIVQGFLNVLRTGKPGNWQAKSDAKDWHESMLDPEFARSFTDLMNCRGMIFGQFLARAITPHLGTRTHLLDVGGGSGIYSSTMTAAHPQLRATVLEQPPVDALVRQEIAKHGLSDRVQVVAGDMFQVTWPQADIVLISNVLHDWDEPVVVQLLAGLGFALLLNEPTPARQFARTALLIPMVLPPIVVGILWRVIFTVDVSPMHRAAAALGMPIPSILTDPALALWAISLVEAWEWFPFTMLMVLAALQMVPASPLEAARIDGASRWQVFRYVVFPYIKPTLVIAGLFRLIDSIKAFPLIFILTDGGPGDVTQVTNYYAYKQAFTFSLWGYGSAIATLVVAGTVLLSWLIDRATGAAHDK